ncbi:uncharacterized protein LOC104870619 [Fukomys damarensis]|uniref:uncharacterized protein LOC104870619 n=1 Tax=Fukomys damarensis TaxID=885580 RepID=UPI00053F590B|nr:uncharacterized protein LOC104870619 [Fukomys damarensis]
MNLTPSILRAHSCLRRPRASVTQPPSPLRPSLAQLPRSNPSRRRALPRPRRCTWRPGCCAPGTTPSSTWSARRTCCSRCTSSFGARGGVALLSHRLQRVLRSIAHQFYPDVPGTMDYAVWTELPSLQSTDEETHLPVFYNLLHCWSMDAKKIHTYLKAVECQVISDGNC